MSLNRVTRSDFEEDYEDHWEEEEDSEEEACLPDPEVEDGPEADVEEAYQLVTEIESIAEEVPERGEAFAQSVLEKAQSIRQTIEESEKVTEPQRKALENMKTGLEKWVR